MNKLVNATIILAVLGTNLGSASPAQATTCDDLYGYYTNIPESNYQTYESQAKDRWLACNTKPPVDGTPSYVPVTPSTPYIPLTKKCPAITRDMHGRKDFAKTTCLAGKNLSGYNLSGMDLTGASLRGTVMVAANLKDAKLSQADATKAVFDYAQLSGTDLRTTKLDGIRANHVTGWSILLPSNWKNFNGLLAGPKVDLSNMWLKGAKISSVDLSGANLTNTRLDGANLKAVNLSNTKFTPSVSGLVAVALTGRPSTYGVNIVNGFLIANGVNLSRLDIRNAKIKNMSCKKCDFSNADLRGTDFSGTDLTGAKFNYANLDKANLGTAKLSMISSMTRVTGTPASLPIGWFIDNGYLKKS